MNGYLGEVEVKIHESEFYDYDRIDWVEYWIASYGQIDGSHHKAWLIDQLMRITKGTEIIVKKAIWDDNGVKFEEYRINLGEPSEEYEDFIQEYENNGEYSWDIGVAP